MTTTTTRGDAVERQPYALARLADCSSPDNETSPGAEFLMSVAYQIAEAIDWADEHNDGNLEEDAGSEIADNAVPIYTHDLWATFVDLAAYNEDPTELGADASDMEQSARACLYMIAQRLAAALIEEASK